MPQSNVHKLLRYRQRAHYMLWVLATVDPCYNVRIDSVSYLTFQPLTVLQNSQQLGSETCHFDNQAYKSGETGLAVETAIIYEKREYEKYKRDM